MHISDDRHDYTFSHCKVKRMKKLGILTWRISDNEPFPRDAEVPVKSRTSSINWKARPCMVPSQLSCSQVYRISLQGNGFKKRNGKHVLQTRFRPYSYASIETSAVCPARIATALQLFDINDAVLQYVFCRQYSMLHL